MKKEGHSALRNACVYVQVGRVLAVRDAEGMHSAGGLKEGYRGEVVEGLTGFDGDKVFAAIDNLGEDDAVAQVDVFKFGTKADVDGLGGRDEKGVQGLRRGVPGDFFSPIVLLKKGMALLVALALLLGIVKLAGAYDFRSAFAVGYGIWLLIDWYDCFILDWVLFANLKAVRLPGTEHMDKAYHQKRYHFDQSLWGMLIGLIPCLMGAAIYAWLF